MRSIAAQNRSKRANDEGMLELLEGLGLGGDRRAGVRVIDEVRAEDLGDDEAAEALVPGNVRLVPIAAPQQLHDEPAWADLLVGIETPARNRVTEAGLNDGIQLTQHRALEARLHLRNACIGP